MKLQDIHKKEMPKVGNYYCLLIMLFDFVLKKDENYFPQKFLKRCKYILQKMLLGVFFMT